MTAHWICTSSLERCSAAIALKRIIGSHTSEVLSKEMENVLEEYNIISQVSKVVTDNGSNFVKALKPPTNEKTSDKDVQVHNLHEILSKQSNPTLPLHQRCACHTLNLCMSSDVKSALKQALKNAHIENREDDIEILEESIFTDDDDFDAFTTTAINYKVSRDSLFNKLKELWRKSKTPLSADIIKDYLEKYLVVPNDTRWNTELYACIQILKFHKEKPQELKSTLQKLKIVQPTVEDIAFLENYVSVSSQIGKALKILEGEKKMYFGVYSPTIHRLLNTLKAMNVRESEPIYFLWSTLILSIEKRYIKLGNQWIDIFCYSFTLHSI